VAPEIVDLVNGFISFPTQAQAEAAAIRLALRRELGWPEGAFVVGGCGTPGWRKGTDVFLQIAQRLCRIPGNGTTRFLWVGGARGSEEVLRFQHDASILGLADRCKIVPNTPAATDYYRAMDVFALTSREDPFPLVMLEAAACHLPTVCFEHSGGGPEFVGQEAGLIVPYLDTATFAGALDSLRLAPQLRLKYGATAARRVLQRHVVEAQGPKILASINRCLASGHRSRSLNSRTAIRHG
jgi:glycosyltransferase involved in cell wall biosynthesis